MRAISDNHYQISKLTQQMAENGLIPTSRASRTLSVNSTECSSFSNSVGFGSTFEYSTLADIVE